MPITQEILEKNHEQTQTSLSIKTGVEDPFICPVEKPDYEDKFHLVQTINPFNKPDDYEMM